ncbi:nuclear transport factor 2-like [Saccoglossus kowalevskii]|uniref:Nuclear transport factor 2-like n=1 Tax=Saccoglossus kowalevskii TaxID=10224 RepID=A0ABM0MCW0_SACKO|nr:PREDICTED: nuclear transport factor 2-like [Saccoglossus kowalevskii]
MSFEGSQVRGSTSIVEKLVTLPFQNISHQLTTVDCQPTLDGTGIVVFVVGQLKTDEDKPHGFSQVFLLKFVDNSCYIANDIFRLSLHHSA